MGIHPSAFCDCRDCRGPAIRRIMLCGKAFPYPFEHPQSVTINCTGERGHPGAHRALVWEADNAPAIEEVRG